MALIDLENAQAGCELGNRISNNTLIRTLVKDDYEAIRFTLGVPFELNHQNPLTAPAPLNESSMHWHWQSGYKFIRAEFNYQNSAKRLHLGSLQCQGEIDNIRQCLSPNRPVIELTSFKPGKGIEIQVDKKLKQVAQYQKLFPESFPQDDQPFTMDNVIKAISAFERTLLSFNSPYDKYLRGEKSSFGQSEKRGMKLFFSEKGECFHCHGGFNFTDSAVHENSTGKAQRFHNTGLYNIDARGGYPKSDRGLYDMTSNKKDMGKFKAPTLRNIAVTAPFMHDGSMATLEEVVDHYINGGRDIRQGKNKDFGSVSPFKSEFAPGLTLNQQERQDLLNFLHSLTDDAFLQNPAFSDPWVK